ncbi:MAG: substrate-binding domain-containing protein, partial [Lachnospiraceae bacterium]|nr:substrate-binding domain-containing protein [Lachnospiraceae bacterium]
MKKRVLATIMSATLVVSMLAGCGSAATTEAPAAEAAPATEAAADAAPAADTASGDKLSFKIVVKSFQSSYWQAAVQGVNQAADKLQVEVECNGPNAESDIADQVNMLTNYINGKPDGIGLAACDQSACLDALQMAKDAGIPVVCFDSGCPDAPEGSVLSTIATDNYGAGATAAENLDAGLKDK